MRKALAVLALALAACARGPQTTPSPSAGRFDVVIAGGKIVDGTGSAWF
jgi:hypothetical protein